MKTPSSRTRAIAAFTAGPIAILIAGAMVWQARKPRSRHPRATPEVPGVPATSRWLTMTSVPPHSQWRTSSPGQTGQKCIVVTSNSNVAGEVRAYTQNLIADRGLENQIFFDLEQGTGGSFNDCTGFTPIANTVPALPLSTLSTQNRDFATGGSSWDTTGTPGETQSYRGTWRFDTTGLTQEQVNALQGARVSIDLVWELQSDTAPTP